MKRFKRFAVTGSLILLILSAAACARGRTGADPGNRNRGAEQDAADKAGGPVVALAWTNIETTYGYTSTITAIEDAGGRPVILDMVRSYDLEYDDRGRLVNACGEHGILSPEAAKKVKVNT